MQPVPRRALVFVALTVCAAFPLVVLAIVQGHRDIDPVTFLSLAVLLVATDSVGLRGSRDSATIALGSVTSMAALPLIGPWGAVVLGACNILVLDHEPLVKRLFNTSQTVLTFAASGVTFWLLGGEGIQPDSFPFLLLPFVAALAVHCVVNGLLVALVVHFHQRVPVRVVLQGTMAGSVAGYVGYGLFGLLLAVLWDPSGAGIGPGAAVLLLLPLLVARWAYAQYTEEQEAYDRTVRALMAAVETKDLYTRGHSERVSTASVLIARRIGMREDRVASVRYAGMLHDVGKLGVPTRVLQKSGRLTEAEFAAVQRHPVQGLEIVREIDFLDEARAGIMHHHERLDGMGYPMGLAGSAIPEFARVIAVADAFDSMTTTRSYRGARSIEDAMVELRRCAGTQFDPQMVEALVSAVETEGWVPEAKPVYVPAETPFDQDAVAYDHDDPTATLVDEPR